jgi:calcium-dependent protein kinase
MAPEVLDGEYGAKCDIWSLGVLMYVLVSGYLPFQGGTKQQIFNKILKGKYHFNHPEFELVSQEAKDLIKKLLIVDPEQRISGEEALRDVWF